jgi:hypothetical protein
MGWCVSRKNEKKSFIKEKKKKKKKKKKKSFPSLRFDSETRIASFGGVARSLESCVWRRGAAITHSFCFWSTVSVCAQERAREKDKRDRKTDCSWNEAGGKKKGEREKQNKKPKTEPKTQKKNHPQEWRVVQKATLRL